jgi:hypothetical protein
METGFKRDGSYLDILRRIALKKREKVLNKIRY